MINIFTDGGSRGNPGPAAIGVVIKNQRGELLYSIGKKIGITTNNVAEYSAVLEAIHFLYANGYKENVNFFLDSELVVSQLRGTYRVKNSALFVLYQKIKKIEKQLSARVSFSHIRREYNKEADSLVNMALDNTI